MNEAVNPWTILAEKEVYANPWISVTEFQVLNPSGGRGIYGKVHFKNLAIGIIPIDEHGFTWLVGQYRFPLNAYFWEIPEGGGEKQATPLESAQRELLEETGLVAGKWTKLLDFHLSNSVSDEAGQIFLAQQLTQHTAAPEETEQLQVKKVHIDEAVDMVEDGRITDSMSVAGLLKVKLMLLRGQLNF